MTIDKTIWRQVELEKKPDFEAAMERVYAWYNQEIIDRAPIRFSAHNAEYNSVKSIGERNWKNLKERWFDTDYQLDLFEHELEHSVFNAETFPFYWPNLGPEVFAAFYGVDLVFQDVTSYSKPYIEDWGQLGNLKIDLKNEYFRKLDEMTKAAIERSKGKYLVGYSSFAPGIDTAAAFRDPQQLCMDFLLEPERIHELMAISSKDYLEAYNHFDSLLKSAKLPSISWMGIPSFGKMHIAQADFTTMISPEHFNEYVLPYIQEEVKPFDQTIFHLDGKGVANHVDGLLEIPEINAIQWVQGVGDDLPIMQWVPLIKKIQKAGKSLVVDLQIDELEAFMQEVDPKGIFLCISAGADVQEDIMKRVEKWV